MGDAEVGQIAKLAEQGPQAGSVILPVGQIGSNRARATGPCPFSWATREDACGKKGYGYTGIF